MTYKQKFEFDRFGNMYRKAASNPTTGQQNPLPYTPIEEADLNKATNRFTSLTTYDEAGQVTTDNKFRSMSFGYDANGRQVKATKANSPDAWTVYDALGNRVATKINDVWQYVVYDAFGKLVAEYGLASEGLGGVKYIQQDWQGSVRAVTNSNGFVTARTDYSAFGEEIGFGTGLRSIEQGYSVDKVARQGYGLTERDDATGLDHTWFRKNENRAGRWTSPDPYKGSMELGNPQSFNRYSYVGNEPTNFVDPSGLLCYGWWVWRSEDGGESWYNTGIFIVDYCDNDGGGDSPSGGGGGAGGNGPFENEVNRRLNQKNCRQKINELFKALGKKFTVDDLAKEFFEGLNGKKVSFENPSNPNASASYSGGVIRIRPRDSNEPSSVSVQGNAGNFLHELLHAAGGGGSGFSNASVVRGIAELDGAKFKEIKVQIESDANKKGLKGDAKTNYIDTAFAGRINTWLGQNCPL